MSVKKQPPGSRSARVGAESVGSSQTPAARRAAEAQMRDVIARFAPEHARLIAAIRRSLRKRLPTAHELVYEYRDFLVISFSPNAHGYEGVFALRASVDGVKLYFNQGKDLPDPARLLKGSGKQARFLVVENVTTLARPEVVSLIDEALALNPIPFDPEGRGWVVMQSKSAR